MRTRTLLVGSFGLMLCGVIAAAVVLAQGTSSQSKATTRADLERWKKELSNWGRWGKEDGLGALNLITPAKRKQAATLVKEGFSVSLARDADYERNVDTSCGSTGNTVCGPYERTMVSVGLDKLAVSFHGYAHTHLDSLAHVFDNGKGYNGYSPVSDVVMKAGGHPRNSVFDVHNGIYTRGILMDIPRLRGVEYLEPGTHIYPQDFEAWEKRAGIKVSPGDALFVRTGRWTRRAKVGPWDVTKQAAGLDASCIPWLKQRDVAVLGGESPQDAAPPGGDLTGLPVHNFALVYLGVQLIDNASLDAVSEAAAARSRWEFQVTVAPLPLRGGTGSPVNPIATF
jgi:kynurenine formamidase